ncbi:MAG: siderophore-interacting protein [Microbacteriaceae bacterium]|nr:siderophore-interacting protein [Microbacteriaceae bacterium]
MPNHDTGGPMPRQIRPTTVHPLALRELEVLRVVDVTPGMRRVTLTGAQLGAFTAPDGARIAPFRSTGFDDDVRVFYPHPGETEPVLPVFKDGGVAFPRDQKVLQRVYTVRRYDEAAQELDLDFVRHGVGIATTWAYRATPGERIHLTNPPASLGIPADAEWLLVAGDDTALPAIARLLEELPADARGIVLIEVAEAAHRQALAERPGVDVRWLVRDGAQRGGADDGGAAPHGALLLEAVRGLELPAGTPFAWLAGEQSAVRDLRRLLVEQHGIDKTRIEFTGYWKHGEVVTVEGDAALVDTSKTEDAWHRFHEQIEVLPGIAIRSAVDLGLAEQLSRGVTTAPALAEALGLDAGAAAKLLRYLEAISIVVRPGGGADYALSETGVYLAEEWVQHYLRGDGGWAQLQRGFLGLSESVRTGRASYASVGGAPFEELRLDPGFEARHLEAMNEWASWLAAPVAESAAFEGLHELAIHSDAAGAHAAALVARHPALRVRIVALPAQAAWLRADLPATIPDAAQRERVEIVEQSITEPIETEAVLIVQRLDRHPDADAAYVLRRAAASAGRVVLVEDAYDPEAEDEHAAEHDLLALTVHGSGNRTAAELESVIAASGLSVASAEPVGWGMTLPVLAPGAERSK